MKATRRLNDGWTFAKSGPEAEHWRNLTFVPVEIPHDWLIADTRNLYANSIGWYRRMLTRGDDWNPEYASKLMLQFDGVYMDSTVYVNGEKIGEWKYGYSAFEFDLLPALTRKDNEIMVKVVHLAPNSRWYSGAGIYRGVSLTTLGASHLFTDGVYVGTKRQGCEWTLEIQTELAAGEDLELSHLLYDGESVVVRGTNKITSAAGSDLPGADTARAERSGVSDHRIFDDMKLDVQGPGLWSPDEPRLYRLVTELRSAASGTLLQSAEQRIGFREIVLDAQEGLSLNGRRMKLNGVCEHHDLGALGAAFNVAAQRRRFRQLKKMGVNAIRTAHNMPAREVMDLADEMGLLVVSEAFDMWERPKTAYDYARFFPEGYRRDIRSWVRRDRNRPSLLLWSIGNEIRDTHADERGQEITRLLSSEVRLHDPRGNARITLGSNYMPWENAQRCADLVKVVGYNYAEKYYAKHHAEHPDWIIYGSETASVVQSRGIYRFPFERSILTDDDRQCSALGNSPTSWGAKSAEACILAERDAPFSLGQFIWTGFDYIGEPTPYHTKNSYFGQVDTAGFPKDSYYVYQSAWTDYRTAPMVHLFPYWDFNDGQLIDVRVCSNAPRIELRLNGESLGFHDTDWGSGATPVGRWKVPYQAGKLHALAYDERGALIAEQVRESFGDAVRLVLSADRTEIAADGRDLLYAEISAEDAEGRPVENAVDRVTVRVSGAGRLLGTDNGDSTDYDAYPGVSRRLFSGKAVAIVGATLNAGPIVVRAEAPGLIGAEAVFEAREAAPGAADGISVVPAGRGDARAAGSAVSGEIALRKIGLVREGDGRLSAERPSARVRAELHPAGATQRAVEWSVVDDAGIASPLAVLELADGGSEAVVTALGDGAFRLRCVSRDSSGEVRLISQLEFEANGLGTAYRDPYGFVSAGVYDYAYGEVGTGNERGIATARDGETRVGFAKLDFGPYGSDTVTLSVFALTDEEYPIRIWAGIPGEARAELLADVVYRKPSIWNTYQKETYRLSRRLRGAETLCFSFRQKVHLKGFAFERQSRAFDLNRALDCDRIYGDAFRRADFAVEEIGNNVSLEYDAMDFGADGTDGLRIRGGSPGGPNTIQIRFEHAAGETRQLAEFAESDGYEERFFPIEPVCGICKVTFIFLPGSRFHFESFRFSRRSRTDC